jgi:ADP-ribosylglycohydrolase
LKDAIINAISTGGDYNTIGALTAIIAATFYGILKWMLKKA